MKDIGRDSWLRAALLLVLVPILMISCSGKKEGEMGGKEEGGEKATTLVDEEVSYSIFFDEEGTKRTLTLEKGQEEFVGYLYVMFPEYLEIASTQFRLDMPEGVVIENDKYRMDRIMSLGVFHRGISERFHPCLKGPKVLLHTFTFRTTAPLSNATFTVLPDMEAKFLAVAECREGFPLVKAVSYKAVVNPSD